MVGNTLQPSYYSNPYLSHYVTSPVNVAAPVPLETGFNSMYQTAMPVTDRKPMFFNSLPTQVRFL